VFLTNNFKLAASTIAQIYKSRWQIELFFKWIKQNLKIKSFLGTSKNAVLTQVWVAMCYYLLLSYIKYQTKFGNSLLYLSRVIRETLFERKTLIDILTLRPERLLTAHEQGLQGSLF
jgi:IS4 transposase